MSTRFDTDQFIAIIQAEPALWDNGCPDYSNKLQKENAWRKIMDVIYQPDINNWDTAKLNTMAQDLQRKWKNLRNSFARELAKRRNSKSGSGRTWKTCMYFEQMAFLIPSMGHAEVQSNLSPARDNDSDQRDVVEPELLQTTSRKRKTSKTDEAALVAVLGKSLQWRQDQDSRMENDPDRLFLLSLLDDFKQIPSDTKAGVKINIITAINNGLHMPYNTPLPPSLPQCSSHYFLPMQNNSLNMFGSTASSQSLQMHPDHISRPNYVSHISTPHTHMPPQVLSSSPRSIRNLSDMSQYSPVSSESNDVYTLY